MATTYPQVFIVESLTFDDERAERFEGRILANMLRLGGKEPLYYYVRTKRELQAVLDLFDKSGYRYLHLSCHADGKSIATTLDDIDFPKLGRLLSPYLAERRLFISACAAVNDQLAQEVMPSGCYSIVGPSQDVRFDEATVMWASFYHLAFRENRKAMKGPSIRPILRRLVQLFGVPINYYATDSRSKKGYRREAMRASSI
jgi:hypothetical protein